jgi:signal peptidase II
MADSTEAAVRPAQPGHRRTALLVAVTVAVIALDQLTKWWAIENLRDQIIPVAWTLRFNLAFNTGTAFSLGSGTGWVRFLPLAVLGVVAYVMWNSRQAMTRAGAVALALILGGAIGNLIDRAARSGDGGFFTGAVIDFIDFQWWPVFNVADMGVVIGGILLVLVSLRPARRPAPAVPAVPDDEATPDD